MLQFTGRTRLRHAWAGGLLLTLGMACATRGELWGWVFRDPGAAEPRAIIPSDRPRLAAGSDGRPRRPSWLDEAVVLDFDLPYGDSGDPVRRLDLLRPRRPRSTRPLPVVVYIHGGAWMSGDKAMGYEMLAELVEGGEYAGVSVDYRLSHQGTWPAQIHDCKAAIRWVRANASRFNLDPDRIGVRGESAGGHLVAMLGTSGDVEDLEGEVGPHTAESSRVTCVVDEYSPSDLAALEIPKVSGDRAETRLIGGPVHERIEAARGASPITHVTRDDPPFLIVHGTDDQTVPFRQAELLHHAQGAAGASTVLVRIEGGMHGGWTNPEVPGRIRAFFDKHLIGRGGEVSGGTVANEAPRAAPDGARVERLAEIP